MKMPAVTFYRRTLRALLPAGSLPLVVTLPQLLLLLLVLYLFVQLFRSAVANRREQETVEQLLQRLQLLERKLEHRRAVDPGRERKELEPLLNRVKVFHSRAQLSDDRQLRFHVTRSYNLISERSLHAPPKEHIPWSQLDALMQDFYGTYFSTLRAPGNDPAGSAERQRSGDGELAGPI